MKPAVVKEISKEGWFIVLKHCRSLYLTLLKEFLSFASWTLCSAPSTPLTHCFACYSAPSTLSSILLTHCSACWPTPWQWCQFVAYSQFVHPQKIFSFTSLGAQNYPPVNKPRGVMMTAFRQSSNTNTNYPTHAKASALKQRLWPMKYKWKPEEMPNILLHLAISK